MRQNKKGLLRVSFLKILKLNLSTSYQLDGSPHSDILYLERSKYLQDARYNYMGQINNNLENQKNNEVSEKIKYCLYARKSTESEERQILSIDSQIKEMLQLAERENLEVIEIKIIFR